MNRIIQEDLARITSAALPWDKFSGARVLITGASGFLAAYMVETLLYLNSTGKLDKQCRVIAVARNKPRAQVRFTEYADRSDLVIIQHDVVGFPPVVYADYIIHAASQASPIYYNTDPVGTLSANTLGTARMLDLALSDCRGLLFFSSGEIYGAQGHGYPLHENSTGGHINPLLVRSCYGESKRMGETMCVAWNHQFGVPAKIVRPWHTYGPGMKLDDGRVFADFTRDILNGGPIVLNSDGSASRSFCYLADATIAFFTVLLLGEDAGAYNVANTDAEVTIAQLAMILSLTQNVPLDWKGKPSDNYVPSSNQGIRADITKIRALGWNPTTGIEEGFKRTVESYGR